MNRQNEILRTDLAHARAEIDKLAPTVLVLDEEQMRLKANEARLREALDSAIDLLRRIDDAWASDEDAYLPGIPAGEISDLLPLLRAAAEPKG